MTVASHISDLPCWTEDGIGWRPSYSPPARHHRSMRADMIVSEGEKTLGHRAIGQPWNIRDPGLWLL